ncbi:hypothetical protein JZ751_027827 [Albula glossodonta]|uniref:Kazal-like domain-containing protein n=1 Tax=Albula glossodonta TaxID=121402 RepID=A0A8T2P9T5_9TELE|nr:hypothetical protein JZ751_027827 [Albula glossodonta]
MRDLAQGMTPYSFSGRDARTESYYSSECHCCIVGRGDPPPTRGSEGSAETSQKETSTCDICQFGAECDEDAEDVCFNPVCASDGKSYDNPCQVKEASCQKQERIEVKHLGHCQGDMTTGAKPGDGHYARKDYTEEKQDKMGEVAIGLYIPCPEHYKNYCVHGECEYPNSLSPPSCRWSYDPGKLQNWAVAKVQANRLAGTPKGLTSLPNQPQCDGDHSDSAAAGDTYGGYRKRPKRCQFVLQSATQLQPTSKPIQFTHCHSGFSGPQCDTKEYNVLYVVPGSGKLRYVLIASIIGAVQVAIICVVVLCITRKCPRTNRINRQKQNATHYSSENTMRASTRLI